MKTENLFSDLTYRWVPKKI